MACRECFDICKVCRVFILVRHLATKLQQTNCIICGYITNSRDHRPLSKLLRHSLVQILQWNPCTACLTYTKLCVIIIWDFCTVIQIIITAISWPTPLISQFFSHWPGSHLLYHFDTSDQRKPRGYISHIPLTTGRYQFALWLGQILISLCIQGLHVTSPWRYYKAKLKPTIVSSEAVSTLWDAT